MLNARETVFQAKTVSASAPTVKAQVPSVSNAGETINLSAQPESSGVPAVEYHWDFGDGTGANGPKVSHAYTTSAAVTIRLTVEGVEGVPAVQSFSLNVIGNLRGVAEPYR
jgi:PKD repeat protein